MITSCIGCQQHFINPAEYELHVCSHTHYSNNFDNFYLSSGVVSKKDTENPKDAEGLKKTRLSLVPPSSTIYEALALEDGATKYGPYNWRKKKVIVSVYLDAAMRHIHQYLDGEFLAKDSKKPHLGHAKACLGIIIDAIETGNLIDDRPAPGNSPELLVRWVKENCPESDEK